MSDDERVFYAMLREYLADRRAERARWADDGGPMPTSRELEVEECSREVEAVGEKWSSAPKGFR